MVQVREESKQAKAELSRVSSSEIGDDVLQALGEAQCQWSIFLETGKGQLKEVLPLKMGKVYQLGRDHTGVEHSIGITCMKISRNQMEITVTPKGVKVKHLGRNAMRLFTPEPAAGSSSPDSIKIHKGTTFTWQNNSRLELMYKLVGQNALVLKKVPTAVPPTSKGVDSKPVDEKPKDESTVATETPTTATEEKIIKDLVKDIKPTTITSEADEKEKEPEKSKSKEEESDKPVKEETVKASANGIHHTQLPRMARTNSSSWLLNGTSPRMLSSPTTRQVLGSPRLKGDGSPLSPRSQRLWNSQLKYKQFSWVTAEPPDGEHVARSEDGTGSLSDQEMLSSSRCQSPIFDSNNSASGGGGGVIRTAESFPFLKKQSSSSSIMSSDKHAISPRSLKRRRTSFEDHVSVSGSIENTAAPPAGDASVVSSVDGEVVKRKPGRPPKNKPDEADEAAEGVGPRVGTEYQVEIPTKLSKPRSLDTIVGKGKGSIGAWAKVMQNEPQPLELNADDLEDTTKNWSRAEKHAFDKSMYAYLKDFISIYRHTPIFKETKRTPRDVIAYYYKQYKDTKQYKKWKQYVSDGNSSQPPHLSSAVSDYGEDDKIVLKDLIDKQLLIPGRKVFVLNYHDETFYGDLTNEGTIVCDGVTYDSITSFNTTLKKKLNANTKHDSGWASVFYEGIPVGHFREEYILRYGHKDENLATSRLGSRKSSLVSGSRLSRTSSMCSTSLPANYSASSTGSAANVTVVGPTTTTHPWSASKEIATNTSGRVGRGRASRGQVRRVRGFFELQIDSDSDDSDDDLEAAIEGNAGLDKNKKRTAGVSLKRLIEYGFLKPGSRVLRLIYKGKTFFGDLKPDGLIVDCQTELEYGIPSLWSMELKRSVNPSLRSDSGWYSIFYIPGGDQNGVAEGNRDEQTKNTEINLAPMDEASRKSSIATEGEVKVEDEDENATLQPGETYENLHTYRKRFLLHKQILRQEKRHEKFSILDELKRMRNGVLDPNLGKYSYYFTELLDNRNVDEDVLDMDDYDSDSNEDGTTRKKRKGGPKKKAKAKKVSMYCMCQRGGSSDTNESTSSSKNWYVQCSKASGACNGWIHPKCFGFDISQKEGEKVKEFVCPLCSADGIDLQLSRSEKVVRDQEIIYSPGTLIMSKIECPKGNPIGWFPGKIIEVDTYNHSNAPYRIVYAFDRSLSEWINLAPNDPTRILAADWSKSSWYKDQDATWRENAKHIVTKSRSTMSKKQKI
eukprot:CAMPEP_0203763062 /NCGR_PEP_ID=MMETSP0098-20131031/15760_1 /ASSEMBLY_ACC=CAM_ASM_000208 /TAXON_ID=96639 /ORGANISM=" , Strain NY0313808BC1" /LENGTH=1236 /DNA_ID=CAMNT_0050657665 /DNA_START=437 /DNA_END=4144 /DNA_ORIENTATION=+